ncbi:MAG: flagellar motor protein MotB [Bdellovibrionota bacterium]
MRKRRRHEEQENHDRWLVSYADFITLLFAFFVVMYATSTKNEDKEKKFEESVKASLKIAIVGMGAGQAQPAGNSVLEKWVPELARGKNEEEDETFPEKGSPAEIADYIKRQLNKKAPAEKLDKDLGPLRSDSQGVRVTLAAASFFPSGSYKLKRSSLETLNQLGDLIRKTNRKIIIEGHTDNTPLGKNAGSGQAAFADSNTDEVIGPESLNTVPVSSNWELASLRATSVVRYLIQMHGIDPKRLSAVAYADQRPVAPNATVEGRAKNRRIEILIVSE